MKSVKRGASVARHGSMGRTTGRGSIFPLLLQSPALPLSRHHVLLRSSNERATRRKNGASLSVPLFAEKLQGCRMNMESHNRNQAKNIEGGGWDLSLPLRFPRKQVQRSVMTADPRSPQRQKRPLRTLESTRAREWTRFLSLENRDRVL